MNAVPPLNPTKDKYAQVLAMHDWNAPYPPRGYQFGVGRGARAFITSAELSSATGAAASFMLQTSDRTGLLDALDRLEERRQKRWRADTKIDHGSGGNKPKMLLSTDDLASIGIGSVGQSLVKRKARTEDMEVVDDYAFADETTVVTAGDLLRSRSIVTNQTLENILDMGSPAEQTTWITHSRAYREMGMIKKAQQTLVEGCRLTGNKGPLIWKERLEYIRDPAAQRLILEDAVKVCPVCEELWLLLLEHEPPHSHLYWLQEAVMACPASEGLWLRVLKHIPTPRDQKKIIRKALEVTPRLPSLWAMLARLENYETGKAIFNAAAEEHLSLQIIIEAAKFEEFHLKRETGKGDDMHKWALKHLSQGSIRSFVQQAVRHFLAVEEEKSRRDWFEAAHAAASERYVITSAYMYLYFVSDKKAEGLSVSTTWMEDLMALIPGAWHTHDVLCSMWAAMLILLHNQMCLLHGNDNDKGNGNGIRCRGDKYVADREMQLMAAALQLAPSSVIKAALSVLREELPSTCTMLKAVEEEEKEELKRPTATTEMTLLVLNGTATSATAASQCLPLPLTFVLIWTVFGMPLLSGAEVTLRIAKVLYDREFFEGAASILKLGIMRHPTNAALFAAAAKSLMAIKYETEAEEILLRGTEIVAAGTDIAWVKLVVHRRSRHEDILPLTENALRMFPKSERLWLMRLEATGVRTKAALEEATAQGASTAPLITGLRQMYDKALSSAHCRFSPTLWCYIAVHLESALLSDAGAARALLLDGAVVCERQHPIKRGEIHAAFGLARCHVELAHAGRETALEVVKETLQLLPKKNGCFTVPVGELVALSIDLEAPAARGRAAAQAVQHWHVRDPLVLASVAKVYHAAGKHNKALDQALKAVKMSKGSCGDAVALWLKLASMPLYREVMAEQMGVAEENGATNTEEVFSIRALLQWLCEQLASEMNMCDVTDDTSESSGSSKRRLDILRPKNGPLWVHVVKARDPSNVTLLGCRDSLELMLERVMDLIEL